MATQTVLVTEPHGYGNHAPICAALLDTCHGRFYPFKFEDEMGADAFVDWVSDQLPANKSISGLPDHQLQCLFDEWQAKWERKAVTA